MYSDIYISQRAQWQVLLCRPHLALLLNLYSSQLSTTSVPETAGVLQLRKMLQMAEHVEHRSASPSLCAADGLLGLLMITYWSRDHAKRLWLDCNHRLRGSSWIWFSAWTFSSTHLIVLSSQEHVDTLHIQLKLLLLTQHSKPGAGLNRRHGGFQEMCECVRVCLILPACLCVCCFAYSFADAGRYGRCFFTQLSEPWARKGQNPKQRKSKSKQNPEINTLTNEHAHSRNLSPL